MPIISYVKVYLKKHLFSYFDCCLVYNVGGIIVLFVLVEYFRTLTISENIYCK